VEGGHFYPSVVICNMSNSTEIEFGWNHVVVSTMIYCSARRHDIGWNLVQMSTWSNEEASILYFAQR